MKKLISLLASTSLVATTSATVVACGDDLEGKVDLSSIIKQRSLGEIIDNQPDTILAILKEKNNDLYINQVSVSNITQNSATISVNENSQNYKGESVEVSFVIKVVATELKNTLKNTNAGVFGFDKLSETSLPTEEQILNSLVKLNSDLVKNDLEVLDIVRDMEETTLKLTGTAVVKVKSTSKNYIYHEDQTGIKITFSVKQKEELIIKTTDIGTIDIENLNDESLPTPEQIFSALSSKNSDLNIVINDLEVIDILRDYSQEEVDSTTSEEGNTLRSVLNTGSAIVKVKEGSNNYIYSADQAGVKITFTLQNFSK